MEGKVAVLGSADFVMPFAALGLDTFATESDAEQVQENAASILKQKYALVVVAENIARSAQVIFDEKAKMRRRVLSWCRLRPNRGDCDRSVG